MVASAPKLAMVIGYDLENGHGETHEGPGDVPPLADPGDVPPLADDSPPDDASAQRP